MLRSEAAEFFIGWDVGGWNCDSNQSSRDALVIIDAQREIVGKPWRGNLRLSINEARSSIDWIARLFALCGAEAPPTTAQITLGVDTPLGFPQAFRQLINGLAPVEWIDGNYDTNPYLFRETEQFLFDHQIKPLSAIKDMIGSQATKGMHVLAKFAPQLQQTGVWTDGAGLQVVEAYPSPCKQSALMSVLLDKYVAAVQNGQKFWQSEINHQDKFDALVCALSAWLFGNEPESLAQPLAEVPEGEGWIWGPQDALKLRQQGRAMLA